MKHLLDRAEALAGRCAFWLGWVLLEVALVLVMLYLLDTLFPLP